METESWWGTCPLHYITYVNQQQLWTALNWPIYRSSARYDLRLQKDANNISLFIQRIFGLQDHNLYLLDCLFLVMNVFFTTPVNVPGPKFQARRVHHVWKFYGKQTEWIRGLKHTPLASPPLCSFSHSPAPSVSTSCRVYLQNICSVPLLLHYFCRSPSHQYFLPDYCRDLQLVSLLSSISPSFQRKVTACCFFPLNPPMAPPFAQSKGNTHTMVCT